MAVVRIAGRNSYLVVYETPTADCDGAACVKLEWDRTDDEVVLRCGVHECHMAASSDKIPPCACIAEVRAFRKSAGIVTDNQG